MVNRIPLQHARTRTSTEQFAKAFQMDIMTNSLQNVKSPLTRDSVRVHLETLDMGKMRQQVADDMESEVPVTIAYGYAELPTKHTKFLHHESGITNPCSRSAYANVGTRPTTKAVIKRMMKPPTAQATADDQRAEHTIQEERLLRTIRGEDRRQQERTVPQVGAMRTRLALPPRPHN